MRHHKPVVLFRISFEPQVSTLLERFLETSSAVDARIFHLHGQQASMYKCKGKNCFFAGVKQELQVTVGE
jgi:hypothetical protein